MTGAPSRCRPQTPDDRARLAEFFAQLSPSSRYQRFFTGMPPKLPSGTLTALSNVDGDRHVGLLALQKGRVVGTARYVRRDNAAVADIAFTVADELQGKGLGHLLIRELKAHAARRGITRFVFDVLAANDAALAVARSLGARLQRDGTTIDGHDLHRVGRRDAEQVERAGQSPPRRDAQADPEGLEAPRLGTDDLAVAVEGGERLRELERVVGDPVRRPALGRLGGLVGERQQLLDQLALGRFELRARRRTRPAPPPPARRRPCAAPTTIRACAYCT